MARGRMLSATISESKKFGNLTNHTSRLVYLMVLPWVDREGRYEADATLISKRVLMRCGIDEAQVELALSDLQRCGLIELYSARGKRVLQVVDFHKWNTPHHKEPDSDLPGPEEGASETQESNIGATLSQDSANVAPITALREVKEREVEVKERKGNQIPPYPPTAPHPWPEEEVEESKRVTASRQARNHSHHVLMDQHPEVWQRLGELATTYDWKQPQHRKVAEKVLDLSRSHGAGKVIAAIDKVLLNAAQVKWPIAFVEKVLAQDAATPAGSPSPLHSDDELDRMFGLN